MGTIPTTGTGHPRDVLATGYGSDHAGTCNRLLTMIAPAGAIIVSARAG